jgi:predicted DNA-binding transcriptional regulator AlpA
MASKTKQTTVSGQTRAVAWTSAAISQWQRDRIAAAGGDASVVPEPPFRFIRLPEVKQLTGLSRSSLYRMCAEKKFPAPVPLSAAAPRSAR